MHLSDSEKEELEFPTTNRQVQISSLPESDTESQSDLNLGSYRQVETLNVLEVEKDLAQEHWISNVKQHTIAQEALKK